MPDFKAGRAYIEVAPSLKGFRRKTESDLNSELATAGEDAGERIGRNIADGAERGASGAGRRSADKFAGEFDRQVRTRITAALKSLPEAKIGASTNEAEQKIKDLRARLLELSDKRIGLDVDASEAIAQIEAIRREMDTIDGETLQIDARVNAAAAMAELDKLKAHSDAVDGDDIHIDVDVDTGAAHANLSALQAHAAATSVSISSIALAIGALGPALIPLAAGGAVALAGVGGAAVGAAGGIGVLAGAIAPVIGAVQALGAAEDAAGKTAEQAARQREAAAQRTTAAAQRVQDAARSVRDAEESAAQRISDAQERLAQVREQAAARAESALRAVSDAEGRLADAQRDSLTAQQAITAARQDARRALEDLSMDLAGAQLRERGAVLSVAEAEAALAKALADPKATELQRERARLALEQAKQTLAEIQLRTKRLAAEKAEADKKGVEGSDQVTRAQDRAKDAADNVREAEKDLAEARAAAVKAQRDGARDVARAARDVARAQRDRAKQVADAQRSLARAQEAYTRSLKDTGTTGSAAMDKLTKAMGNLTPAGQEFARWLFGLKDGLVELSKIAQDRFLPGLQEGLESLGTHAGLFKDAIGAIATVLGDLARDAGKALSGPFWTQFLEFLAAKTPKWLDTLGRTLGAAATGMAALFQALEPLIDAMGAGTLGLMERFADWAKGLGEDQGFQRFLAYVKETGPKVVSFLGAFFRAVGNIVIALAPFGNGVLDALTSGLNWIAEQDPDKIRALATSVLAVAGGLKALAVAQGIVNVVMALSPWGLVAVAIVGVAGALTYLYQTNADFKAKIDEIWAGIKQTFTGTIAAIQAFWTEHGEAIKREWNGIWTTIQRTFASVWKSIQDIARSVGGWLQLFWQEWGGRLTAFFKSHWESVKRIFDGAMQVLRGIFEFFAGLFTGDWGRMWNGLKEVFNGAWKVVTGAVKIGIDTLKLLLSLAWAAIKTVALKAWNGIVDGIKAIWDKITEVVAGPIDRMMQFIQENFIDKINGLFKFLHIPVYIKPIWVAGVTDAAYKGSRTKNERQTGFRQGGYTGNKGVNSVAGVVHGREFVMDADTTQLGGGPQAMEAIRRAIQSGWKPLGYKGGGYVNPVGKKPSFPWGRYPSGGYHPAYDYAVPVGTRVRAPYSGVITRDGWDSSGYGIHAGGRSDSGVFWVLGHMLRELVSVGQRVVAGQLVGYSGSTGRSTGPHVHFGTSTTPNMLRGAFNPDTGGTGPGGGNFVTNTLATLLTAGIGGFTSFVSSGLSRFGMFGQLLGGAIKLMGTGAANLGVRLLGLDSGGQIPGAADGAPREVKPLLFDSGGILPTGISIVKNATGSPEPLMRVGRGGSDQDRVMTAILEKLGALEDVIYAGSRDGTRDGIAGVAGRVSRKRREQFGIAAGRP